MKKYYLLITLFLSSFFGISQIINIPDANFKNALINDPVADLGIGDFEDVDTNNDGEIQVTEAEAVVRLNVNYYEISSLVGIEFFTNLIELECNDNFLTSLNVSQNISLGRLYCGNNNLTELDVSQNINLGFLWCYNNNIDALDISMLLNLININCKSNNISELDVSQNIELSTLNCGGNNLSTLDVSLNTALTTLSCGANNLSILDVSNNSKIYFLTCGATQIEELDLSNNPNLSWLQCQYNESLSYLDIRNGYIQDISLMWAFDTPNLDCILVDDQQYAYSKECGLPTSGWCIDENDLYIEDIEDCIFGIEDNLETQLSIYPNPAKDLLYLYNESTSKITSIKIYDMLGKLVLKQSNPSNQIDISNLSTGLFFVQIETTKGSLIKKIVKE